LTSAAEAPQLGVGSALEQARQAQGLGIADVSVQLKFMTRQIEALEHERFDALPGPTIARGMVRTYARFLKLDPEPLLERMAGHVETRDATPQLAARFRQPVPFADSGRRSTVVYLALSACVLAVGGGVLYEWSHERAEPHFIAAADLAPAAKPVRQAPAKSPKPAAVASTQSPAPQAAPAQVAAAQVAPPSVAVPPAQPKAVAPSTSLQVAAAAPTSSVAGSHRIVFRFEEEAWIEVTDGAGRLLASSLNPSGTERVVQGRPPFTLVIGNASHVRLKYNERDVDLQPHVRVEVARLTLQ
jgi:cytoskeleton protein RodZ